MIKIINQLFLSLKNKREEKKEKCITKRNNREKGSSLHCEERMDFRAHAKRGQKCT